MDKLAKVRAEIEKLNAQLLRGACSSQIAMETMCKEEAYNEVLAILDSMQEEPVSIWHDASKKSDNPEDVVIINPSDNTGEVLTKCTGVNQGHIWAYTSELLKLDNPCNIGKNLQEPQVKESAEIQHVNDMCKENGNSLTQELVNVWHDAQTEQPQAKEKILATNEYGDCEVDFAINMVLYWKKVIKWAYIEDLLNLSNVQRTVKNSKELASEGLEKAEKFIDEHTKYCSNLAHYEELNGNVWKENTPWLTPDQARRAVEIAREEMIKKACEYLDLHCDEVKTEDNGIAGWIDNEFIDNFRKAMKDE